MVFHPLVAWMWRRNHLPIAARIRHLCHEPLLIYVEKVENLCEGSKAFRLRITDLNKRRA
jgi:hypothetical protein